MHLNAQKLSPSSSQDALCITDEDLGLELGSAGLDIEVVGDGHRVRKWDAEDALGIIGRRACSTNSSGIKDRVSAGDGNGCSSGLTEGVDLHGYHDTTELARRQCRGRIGGGNTVSPRGMGTILAGTSCRAGSGGNSITQAFV